jgi:hypothetical protein
MNRPHLSFPSGSGIGKRSGRVRSEWIPTYFFPCWVRSSLPAGRELYVDASAVLSLRWLSGIRSRKVSQE